MKENVKLFCIGVPLALTSFAVSLPHQNKLKVMKFGNQLELETLNSRLYGFGCQSKMRFSWLQDDLRPPLNHKRPNTISESQNR